MDNNWWQGAVFYQIYPRSFKDSNDDGIGDLAGITSKMAYISSLGVDAIWLSPFYKSPMADFGYDVADYCDVDPIFGSIEDFDALLKEAHDQGLKVVIDLVLSHSSDQHEWFEESRQNKTNPKADYYVWEDPNSDGMPPNNWLSVFGGVAWEFEPRRGQYYLHNFLKEQPDLNVNNPEVRQELLDVTEFWLKRGVDGFRLDVINFCIHDQELRDNPPVDMDSDMSEYRTPYDMQESIHLTQPENLDFIRQLRALTDKYDGSMMVGEVAADMKVSAEYTASPDLLHTAYNFNLLSEEFSAAHIRDTLTTFANYPGDSWPSWSFSNHDVQRVASRWADGDPSEDQAKMLMMLLLSLQGTIFMYQGDELGLTEVEVKLEDMQDPQGIALYPLLRTRDGCRTPMPWENDKENAGFSAVKPWLPVADEHKSTAINVQDKDPDSVLNSTRSFIQWRKQHPALIKGDLEFIECEEPVLAFKRTYEGEIIIFAFNLGNSEQSITLQEDNIELKGGTQLSFSQGTVIKLPAYGSLIGIVIEDKNRGGLESGCG